MAGMESDSQERIFCETCEPYTPLNDEGEVTWKVTDEKFTVEKLID
jgi:hypothetical protein